MSERLTDEQVAEALVFAGRHRVGYGDESLACRALLQVSADLAAATGSERTEGCISGCAVGLDHRLNHHAHCRTFGAEAVIEVAGHRWVRESARNTSEVSLAALQRAARETLPPADRYFVGPWTAEQVARNEHSDALAELWLAISTLRALLPAEEGR